MPDQKSKLEALCAEKGLKMTDQRRVIARVLSESHDHPDVEALHKRAVGVDPNISIATVYRTVATAGRVMKRRRASTTTI